MDYRRTYRAAAVTFVDLVSRVPADRWDAPGLGEWTLRELVAHTAGSALRQVPGVLRARAETAAVTSPEAYWTFARSVPPEVYAEAVAASTTLARQAAAELASAPAGLIGDLAGRATQALAAAGDDDVVSTPVGGMRVRDWMPTRTFELVVHGLDVAAAAGLEADFPPDAVSEATLLAARVAAALGDGPAVLFALTGRAPLPKGFTVL
ncbi:maleylpyruvate isomerase N-terminal domain-containing protein [Actinoplanes sp. NPDC048796]|uniref:maleylpyruvate isomerase N-terminal domain-containing protein n=1 Tax=Actinoplanes sp. NPDC048796 TaxID=3155640 RepID=UPI0033E80AA3